MDFGFLKISALSPRTCVANPDQNKNNALTALRRVEKSGVQVAVLPELCLSGYTCGDLFGQDALLDGCEAALLDLAEQTSSIPTVIIVGVPLRADGLLYNCAAVLHCGSILGVVPKTYLPNYQEFYEKRWFASGAQNRAETIRIAGSDIPFGNLLFRLNSRAVLGVEICEDLWVPLSPGTQMALAGANVIVNLSASNEAVAKNDYRLAMITQQSAKALCAYAYASAGIGESTTDLVFSGACTIAENGTILADAPRFLPDGSEATACVDLDRLLSQRRQNGSFPDNAARTSLPVYRIIDAPAGVLEEAQIDRAYEKQPFVPADPVKREKRCQEILSIQSAGLARRLSHTGLKKLVLGISGGLDSTLALLVSVRAMELLKLPKENILCVTMPGFGTTDRTYDNAVELIHCVGAEFREIDIRPACLQHMADIGHDPDLHDITFENTQARERTQILMDLANKEGGILVGTGDLSELALGWCTYNADHMSMYGVNCGVPKTLVRHLVENVAAQADERTASVLRAVLGTPVSPELLPPDECGEIAQKTEEKIGPYELHDFFLYHFLRFGTNPQKLLFLAKRAFGEQYTRQQLTDWLRLFLMRFFQSQFKRSCLPDGPKVGSVSLSPRGDWRMPSDAEVTAWLAALDKNQGSIVQ